jgi:hypothetical protein
LSSLATWRRLVPFGVAASGGWHSRACYYWLNFRQNQIQAVEDAKYLTVNTITVLTFRFGFGPRLDVFASPCLE